MADPFLYLVKGNAWSLTDSFLDHLMKKSENGILIDTILKRYGEKGVAALNLATPRKTGKTADSWYYEIEETENDTFRIIFGNRNIVDGYANIAILIDSGHLAKNGVWIEGRNYIYPAIQPVFDEIANSIWKELIET